MRSSVRVRVREGERVRGWPDAAKRRARQADGLTSLVQETKDLLLGQEPKWTVDHHLLELVRCASGEVQGDRQRPRPLVRVSDRQRVRTWWNVVALFYRHVLRHLERVHGLEHREALADRVDANVPQRLMVKMHENLARDAMLCPPVHSSAEPPAHRAKEAHL